MAVQNATAKMMELLGDSVLPILFNDRKHADFCADGRVNALFLCSNKLKCVLALRLTARHSAHNKPFLKTILQTLDALSIMHNTVCDWMGWGIPRFSTLG